MSIECTVKETPTENELGSFRFMEIPRVGENIVVADIQGFGISTWQVAAVEHWCEQAMPGTGHVILRVTRTAKT